MANPFLDPGDGHVLAGDADKNRQAKEYGHVPTAALNPCIGPGVPIMSPAVRFTQTLTGETFGPVLISDLAAMMGTDQ
jgi:hypothetical protein